MSVRKRSTKKGGKTVQVYFVDFRFKHSDGRVERVRMDSPVNTQRGAEQYERELRQQLLAGTYRRQEEAPEAAEVPTFSGFKERFLTYSETNNKAATVEAKRQIIRTHLEPFFGRKRLDAIGVPEIEAYKASRLKLGRSPKTINNTLTVLHNMLALAVEYRHIDHIPHFKWMKRAITDFDFFTFEEAPRLVEAADGQWKTMVLVAMDTGLRRGELIALQWDAVDLVAGRLVVKRNVWRGHFGTPKGGRPREVPLTDRAIAALKAHRHLRGQYVFCNEDGTYLKNDTLRKHLNRICKRAGLREVGWHTLRHTFASHLVMKGVPLKAVQELMGHATIDMTMKYAHLSPDARREAIKVLERPAVGNGWAMTSGG